MPATLASCLQIMQKKRPDTSELPVLRTCGIAAPLVGRIVWN